LSGRCRICENLALIEKLTASTVPYAALVAALMVTLLVRQILLSLIDRKVPDRVSFAHHFVQAVRLPSALWCFAIAIAIAIRTADLTRAQLFWANKSIGAFLIISIGLVIAAIFVRMIAAYGERNRMPFAVAGLSRTLTYVFVLSVAGLMLLRLFDIEITPLLTALGVGGLAVALALQDTLANFFAGIHILIEEPIVVGDFVKLSTGEEGLVRDIGWRTTRMQTGVNNTIVIPNTKITSGILTNFSMPERRVFADVNIITGLHADPEQVKRIALEVASQTEGVLTQYAPVFLFDPGVMPTYLGYKLLVQVNTQIDKGGVQSAIRLRLLARFRSEGVPIPGPEKIAVVQP
jgi:small-conductance mechanosensitive channel